MEGSQSMVEKIYEERYLMTNKDLHEKVSEILSKVIDLPYDDGLRKIENLCSGNEPLKSEVLSLFKEINNIAKA